MPHMQLTEGDFLFRTVGHAVHDRAAHAADALSAVMVERHRVFAFLGEFFVEDIEHFQKRHIRADAWKGVVFEIAE